MLHRPASLTMSKREPSEPVWELATNLDDVTGELIAAAMEALLAEGALDVWCVPLTMKKGRPGVMLCLLCAAADRDGLARRVLELTGSLGVRYRAWERLVLDRRFVTLDTLAGPVQAKVGEHDGHVVTIRPEYEDVKRAAALAGLDVRSVYESAQASAEAWRAARAGEDEGGEEGGGDG